MQNWDFLLIEGLWENVSKHSYNCISLQIDKDDTAVVVSNTTTTEVSGEGFDQSTYVAPVFDSSIRDFGSDFLLILILPLAVVVIIAIILAIIMFCFREGRWALVWVATMIFCYLTVLESFLIIFHEKKTLLLYPSSLIHFQNHYISKGLIFSNLYNPKKKKGKKNTCGTSW